MDAEGSRNAEGNHGNKDGNQEGRLVILGKDEEEEVHHSVLHNKDAGMEEDSEVFHTEVAGRTHGDKNRQVLFHWYLVSGNQLTWYL